MRTAVPAVNLARSIILSAVAAALLAACGNPVAPQEPKAAKPAPKLTTSGAGGIVASDSTGRSGTQPWY